MEVDNALMEKNLVLGLRHHGRVFRAVASPPGHQFQSPAIRRSAGPITIRTSVASINTATANVNPIILTTRKSSEGECCKYHDHDRGCARNEACRSSQTLWDRVHFTHPAPSGFKNACHQKDFVVHAQSKDDGKGDDRNKGEYATDSPGTPRKPLPRPSWKTRTNAPKDAATENKLRAMAFSAAKIDRKPQSSAKSVPPTTNPMTGGKPFPDDRFIIGVEGRDAPHKKSCAIHTGESQRPGLPNFPHPNNLIADRDRTRRYNLKQRRSSITTQKRSTCLPREVEEGSSVAFRDRSDGNYAGTGGSLARRFVRRSTTFHPASVCGMEFVGSSIMIRNDSTTPSRSIFLRVWRA